MLFLFFVFGPALCVNREFGTFRRYQYGSDVRFGHVADDGECLEVMTESLVRRHRYDIQEFEIVTTVQCSRYRVNVQSLSRFERITLERNLVGVKFHAEAAVPLESLRHIRKSAVHEITIRRNYT